MRQAAATERWAAVLLLATSSAVSAWLQHEAGNVVERTHAREQQIERLASLMAAPPPVAGGVLADFDGLFAGHRVAWQQTATGPVLVLRVRPDEVPR